MEMVDRKCFGVLHKPPLALPSTIYARNNMTGPTS